MSNVKPQCSGECTSRIAVLESQMTDVRETLHDINSKLDKVLDQTTRTNGRVTRLESDLGRNFDKDEKLKEVVTELEKGNVKLWLIIGASASVISSVVPLIVGKFI